MFLSMTPGMAAMTHINSKAVQQKVISSLLIIPHEENVLMRP